MGISDWGFRAAAKTGRKLLSAADHLDERAGELRDEVKRTVKESRRLQRLRTVLQDPEPLDPPRSAVAGVRSKQEIAEAMRSSFSYGDEGKQAQVFGGRGCPWTGRALLLLEQAGVETAHVDLDHAASGPMREELSVETGQMTVPYVFLRGRFVGGYNALDEIQRLGHLEYLTLTSSEQLAHPDHGRFGIAERPTSNTP